MTYHKARTLERIALAEISEFIRTHSRSPKVEELLRLLLKHNAATALAPPPVLQSLVEAMVVRRPVLDAIIIVREPGPTTDSRKRAAERRLAAALRFLPAGEREHYRAEWSGEMQAMEPAVAAQFAANVLLHAPLAGMSLRFAKLFKRRAT